MTRTETGETELGSLKVTFSWSATLLKLIHTYYTCYTNIQIHILHILHKYTNTQTQERRN